MFEAVIGLEIHAQLLTASKLFCGCACAAGETPNSRTCPVCLGLPGTLPVLNTRAVDQAITAALALGCRINPLSVFARKNYFYPDLPKGYQITQYDQPLAESGHLAWTRRGRPCDVRIVRVHLEEDAGKSLHDGFPDSDRHTYVDNNRAGVPLAEIVTAPDLRTAEDAAEFFRQLRAMLVEAGVTDGNLEEGNLRCDANVSVREAGSNVLGDRTEIKNLNSFRHVERALDHEIRRQTALIAGGGRVDPSTLLWDDRGGVTVLMRSKEDAGEYRYFPEPDLPPLVVDTDRVLRLETRLPELPEARRGRLQQRYGLAEEDAILLASSASMTMYFEAVVSLADPRATAQWLRGEVTRRLRESGLEIDRIPVPPDYLARLIGLVEAERVSASAAKVVFARMWETKEPPDQLVETMGLAIESNPDTVLGWVDDVLALQPAAVAQHRQGKRGALGFLVGHVIKLSGGRANPRLVDELVRARLDGTHTL